MFNVSAFLLDDALKLASYERELSENDNDHVRNEQELESI